MTSKEAAYILKNTAFLDGKRGHEKTEEAIKTAISALETIDHITAERDGAVKDLHDSEQMHNACFFCKYYDETPFCNNNVGGGDIEANDMWEWRGVTDD